MKEDWRRCQVPLCAPRPTVLETVGGAGEERHVSEMWRTGGARLHGCSGSLPHASDTPHPPPDLYAHPPHPPPNLS